MLRIFRVTLLAAAAFLLNACSSVKLAYHQLDWVVPLYLESYVGLDRAQSRLLKDHVGELLQWHCGTQLVDYARDVRAINARFQDGAVSPARLDPDYDRILAHWDAIRVQAAPRVAALLAGASDEQLAELFANLERENRKLEAEHVDRPEARQRAEARELMAERLEYWIGDLDASQRDAISAWSRAFAPNGLERLEFRRRWQAELRQALKHRDAYDSVPGKVEALIARPEMLWRERYRATREHNRRELLNLLARVGATLSPAQRAQLARRADVWAESFEQLACAPAPIRSAAAPAPTGTH